MNAAEVVVSEVQSECGPVVLKLLREAIGQPGESSDVHSHGEILPFDV